MEDSLCDENGARKKKKKDFIDVGRQSAMERRFFLSWVEWPQNDCLRLAGTQRASATHCPAWARQVECLGANAHSHN